MRQNGTRRHYATLSGSTESYGERTQTRTFEYYANLLASLLVPWETDRCTPWRMAFKALLNAKVALPWALLKFSLRLLLQNNCQNGLLLKHGNMYCRLSIDTITCVGTSTIHLRSTKPPTLLSTLHHTWWRLQLPVEKRWSMTGGPFVCFLAQMGTENAPFTL